MAEGLVWTGGIEGDASRIVTPTDPRWLDLESSSGTRANMRTISTMFMYGG